MAPHVPGVPGLQLPNKPPPEKRPTFSNPPPPESRPPQVSEGHIVLARGRWSLSLPSAFALAFVASAGGWVASWLNKPAPDDPAAIATAMRAEASKTAEAAATRDAAITKRLGDLEGDMRLLNLSIRQLDNRVTDKLTQLYPPRVDPLAAPVSAQLRK